MNIYTLRDIKVGEFLPPFIAANDSVARRLLVDSDGSNSIIYKFPQDFELFQVGEYNPQTGQVKPVELRTLGLLEILVNPNQIAD